MTQELQECVTRASKRKARVSRARVPDPFQAAARQTRAFAVNFQQTVENQVFDYDFTSKMIREYT